MRVILPCFAKINLSLRVINRRHDGYHNLVSAFVKINSGDVLYISESTAGIDIVNANMNLEGENIVAKALRLAREEGFKIPCLNVKIHKSIPPGSGLGAGSGNAAAVLQWLGAERIAPKVGADVAFLCSNTKIAMVSGIGDIIEKVPNQNVHGVIAIPDWETNTKEAYSELDAMGYDKVDIMLARKELIDVYHANASAGKKIGLLPNDFVKVLVRQHPKYNELFRIFQKSDANAWGITGSGSAVFGLLNRPAIIKWPEYIKHVLYF